MGKTLSLRLATQDKKLKSPGVDKLCEIRKSRMLNLHIAQELKLSRYSGLPELKPYNGEIPGKFIPFNQALTSKDYNCGVHFFIDDYQFERIWNRPERYLELMRKFKCVTSPDFSLYVDMPLALQLYNTYRNRILSAWMQRHGVNVLPSVSWSDESSYRFCYSGIPEQSMLAISSTGAMETLYSRKLFIRGLERVFKNLSPSKVVMFGKSPNPEVTKILEEWNGEFEFKEMQYGRTR